MTYKLDNRVSIPKSTAAVLGLQWSVRNLLKLVTGPKLTKAHVHNNKTNQYTKENKNTQPKLNVNVNCSY